MMAALLYKSRIGNVGVFRAAILTCLNGNRRFRTLLLMKVKDFSGHQTALSTSNNHLFIKVWRKHIQREIGTNPIGIINHHKGMIINIRSPALMFKIAKVYCPTTAGIYLHSLRLCHQINQIKVMATFLNQSAAAIGIKFIPLPHLI